MKRNKIEMKVVVLVVAVMAAGAGFAAQNGSCGVATNGTGLTWIAPHRQVTEAQRDAEMFGMRCCYRHDMEKFEKCHRSLGGSRTGWAEAKTHQLQIEEQYESVINPWLMETSLSPLEQRLIRGYKPTPEEALVPRKRLLEKIDVWNRVKWAKGTFRGQKISFVDGCASYRDYDLGFDEDTKKGWPMKLRIDRDLVWKYGNRDYVMAHSDCAANIDSEIKKDDYGGTDALRSCWFLGFLNGELVDACDLGNVYWDDDDEFFLNPENNRLEIVNAKTGDDRFELFLSLWDYQGGFHHFGTNETVIVDKQHDCSKVLVRPPEEKK